VVWDASDRQRAHVVINTPATRAAWGLIGGGRFDLGGIDLQVGQVDRDYAVLVVTSLDGQPLESSKQWLLAAVGSAQNQGMVWNESRTSVGNQWGTGPAIVNGITAQFEVGQKIRRIQALDGRGQPRGEVPLQTTGGSTRFTIGPAHQTLWYVIELP
jgi:hypothetical protein